MSQKLIELLKKMGNDDLADLQALLIPAMEEEINDLFPTVAPTLAAAELAFNPMLQAALNNIILKIQL